MRKHITYATVVSTLALFVVLGGGAYAVTGRATASGVIHGCVASDGTLQIVSNSHACHKARGHGRHRIPGEKPTSWNQQGPAGPPGENAFTHLIVRTSEFPHGGVALNAEAVCQPGEQAVGGGGTGGGGDPLVSSYPTFQSGPATGREVFEAGDSNNAKNPPAAAVICASP